MTCILTAGGISLWPSVICRHNSHAFLQLDSEELLGNGSSKSYNIIILWQVYSINCTANNIPIINESGWGLYSPLHTSYVHAHTDLTLSSYLLHTHRFNPLYSSYLLHAHRFNPLSFTLSNSYSNVPFVLLSWHVIRQSWCWRGHWNSTRTLKKHASY